MNSTINSKILVCPDLKTRVGEIEKVLLSLNFDRNHPDLLYFDSGEKLGIAAARKIKEHFSLKPFQAKGRVLIIEDSSKLTDDAQNALLKILEEPPEESLIILGTEKEEDLLPTILSRCQIQSLELRIKNVELETFNEEIERITRGSIDEKFEFVEKLEEKEIFLKELLLFFRKRLKDNPNYAEFLKEALRVEQYFKANVNQRAALEYLMLILPKTD